VSRYRRCPLLVGFGGRVAGWMVKKIKGCQGMGGGGLKDNRSGNRELIEREIKAPSSCFYI
jgi:hypothetical protein